MTDEPKDIQRICSIERLAQGDGDKQTTVYRVSLSSETPIQDWPLAPPNLLSHEAGAIDLSGVAERGLPLMVSHRMTDVASLIGRVVNVRPENRRLVGELKFSSANPEASVVRGMVDEGTLTDMSITAQPIKTQRVEAADGRIEALRWTKWRPIEASVVPVGADHSVGIGRQEGGDESEVRTVRASPAAGSAESRKELQMDVKDAPAGGAAEIKVDAGFDPVVAARARTETIRKLAESNDIRDEQTVMHWVRTGKSWDDIANDILRIKEERSKASPAVLGLTPKEMGRFSIVRAINAVINRDWSKAGYEAEISRATAQRMGRVVNEHTFIMPADMLAREMIVGTASSGGYLVGTDIKPEQFIDLLRNRSVVMRLGARTLGGLQGSVTIPTQAAAGSVGWLGESGTATESNATVGQKTLSPKTAGGYQQYSRQLMLQSSIDVENFIQQDLAKQIALAVDSAALAGTSTNSTQPLGIRYTSGLGTANPTSGTAVTYADMIRFQSTVATSNALFEGFSYVTHPAVAGLLMGKSRFTNSDTPIWEGALLDGRMVGVRSMSSVQITSGTMLGGDFSQVIIGEWGTVEIEVNPYANFQAGIVGVRAMYSCDVLVRYGAAFAIGTGMSG
jgi:HK97 family phage major capsid protein